MSADPVAVDAGQHQLASEELLGCLGAENCHDGKWHYGLGQTHEVEQLAAGHSCGHDLDLVDRNVNEKCGGGHGVHPFYESRSGLSQPRQTVVIRSVFRSTTLHTQGILRNEGLHIL